MVAASPVSPEPDCTRKRFSETVAASPVSPNSVVGLMSGCQKTLVVAWCPRCSPVSLGKPLVTVCPQEKAGHMEWSMRYKAPTGNAEMMTAMAKLEREIDESASDVVVYGLSGVSPGGG